MYSAMVLVALCNMIYLALHVTGSGSFPKPLSKEEEEECLERIQEGDEQAKNKLIEHNLRLVAHIIKKYYASYRLSLIHIYIPFYHTRFCMFFQSIVKG